MSLVDNWNDKVSFWEMNPQNKLLFSSLYKSDKSKNKVKSSNIMWAIALCYDSESKLVKAKIPLEDRIDLIEKDVLENVGYFKANYKILKPNIEKYLQYTDTEAKIQMRAWNDLITKRTEFIQNQEYSEDSWEMLDKMMGSTKKIFEDYFNILDRLEKEKATAQLQANSTPSLNDSNEW